MHPDKWRLEVDAIFHAAGHIIYAALPKEEKMHKVHVVWAICVANYGD